MASSDLFGRFPKYEDFAPSVPVARISAPGVPSLHRFYDTSPISPSGRYIALLEFPFEDRLPNPGDMAHVYVIDLETTEIVFRAPTAAWDTQVGAHVQWGDSDEALYFNRLAVHDWRCFGIRANIFTGAEIVLDQTVYMVAPDGKVAATPSLAKINLVQVGYGAHVPKDALVANRGAPADDGLFLVDTASGCARLLVSFEGIYEALKPYFGDIDLKAGGFYGFHVKWNPQGTRIMFILRWQDDGAKQNKSRNYLITLSTQGDDIRLAVGARRWKGGHHPNWCPNGDDIVMNLLEGDPAGGLARADMFMARVARKLKLPYRSFGPKLRFTRIRYDGTSFETLSRLHLGSGHPTMHRDERHILSDSYPSEPVAFGDGTIPLRWIEMESEWSQTIVRMRTMPRVSGVHQELRVDPHPAWDGSGRFLVFNGCPNGTREVFIADVAGLVD